MLTHKKFLKEDGIERKIKHTHVRYVIYKQCISKFLFIGKDQMYTMNFFIRLEKNSFNPILKTTSKI